MSIKEMSRKLFNIFKKFRALKKKEGERMKEVLISWKSFPGRRMYTYTHYENRHTNVLMFLDLHRIIRKA